MTTLPSEAIRPIPSLEDVLAADRFWAEHWEQFMLQYPEQFVAVRHREVVAASPDLSALYYALRGKGLRMRGDVWVSFISDRLKNMVL